MTEDGKPFHLVRFEMAEATCRCPRRNDAPGTRLYLCDIGLWQISTEIASGDRHTNLFGFRIRAIRGRLVRG